MKKLLVGVLALGLSACGLETALEDAATEFAKDQALRLVVKEVAKQASSQMQAQGTDTSSAAPAYSTAAFDEFPEGPTDDTFPEQQPPPMGEAITQEQLDELCAGASDPTACKEQFADAFVMEMNETIDLGNGGSMTMVGTFAMAMTGSTSGMLVNANVTFTNMKVDVDGKSYTASGSEEFKGEMTITMPEIDMENPQPMNPEDISATAKFQSKGQVTVEGESSTYEITTEMLSDGTLKISGNIDGEPFSETVAPPQMPGQPGGTDPEMPEQPAL